MRAVLVLMLLLTTPSLAELRPVTRAVTVNPTNAALWFPDAEQFGAANEFVRRVESDDGTAGSPGKPEDPPGKPEDPPGKPNKPGK
jgi:hypothetical protein